jgi:hypothetical protein
MIDYPWAALITGAMLALSGGMTLVRHFLLEPLNVNYPKAPVFVRHGMFAFAVVLVFLGLQFIWIFFEDRPNTVPPQPGTSLQFLSMALFIYTGIMLGNIARQHYPATTWKKIERINDSLLCRDKGFWAKLFHS